MKTLSEVLKMCNLNITARTVSMKRFDRYGATPKYGRVDGVARSTYMYTDKDAEMIYMKEQARLDDISKKQVLWDEKKNAKTGSEPGSKDINHNRRIGYYTMINPVEMINTFQGNNARRLRCV